MKVQFRSFTATRFLMVFSSLIISIQQCPINTAVPISPTSVSGTTSSVTKTVAPVTTTTVPPQTTTTAPVTTTTATEGCKTCPTLPISGGELAHPFANDITDDSGTCLTRTLVCTAPTIESKAIIKYNGDLTLNEGVGSVTSIITCNDQEEWTGNGTTRSLIYIECQYEEPKTSTVQTTSCKTCPKIPITSSMISQPFANDITDDSGTCLMRTLVCTAPALDYEVMIEINGDMTIADSFGSTTAVITCNDQGQWFGNGTIVPITSIQCQYDA